MLSLGTEMLNAACSRVPLNLPESTFSSSAWSSWSRPHGVVMLVTAPIHTVHSVHTKVTGLLSPIKITLATEIELHVGVEIVWIHLIVRLHEVTHAHWLLRLHWKLYWATVERTSHHVVVVASHVKIVCHGNHAVVALLLWKVTHWTSTAHLHVQPLVIAHGSLLH